MIIIIHGLLFLLLCKTRFIQKVVHENFAFVFNEKEIKYKKCQLKKNYIIYAEIVTVIPIQSQFIGRCYCS